MRRSLYQKSVFSGPLFLSNKITEEEDKRKEEKISEAQEELEPSQDVAGCLPLKEEDSPSDQSQPSQTICDDNTVVVCEACEKCEDENMRLSEDSENASGNDAETGAAAAPVSEQSSSESFVTQSLGLTYINEEEGEELFTRRSSENSDFTAARASWKSGSDSDETTATFSDRRHFWSAMRSAKLSEGSDSLRGIDTEGSEVSKITPPVAPRRDFNEVTDRQTRRSNSIGEKCETEETKSGEDRSSTEKSTSFGVISKQQRMENFRKSKKIWNYPLRRSDDASFGSFDTPYKFFMGKSFDDVMPGGETSSTRLREEVGLPAHLSRDFSADRYTFSRLEKILTSFESDPFGPAEVRDFESFCDAVMFGKKADPKKDEQENNRNSQIQNIEETTNKLPSVDSSVKAKRKDDLSQKLKCLLL